MDRVGLMRIAGVSEADLDAAREVIYQHLRPTPLVRLDLRDGHGGWAKLETMNPSGAFKVRGALAACSAYGAEGERIVTASSGNHGIGVAYAATVLGVEATVVVPANASPAKVAALRSFDIDLRLAGDGYDQAEEVALEIVAKGGRFLSSYNDPHVIAGQTTVVMEVIEQAPAAATVVVPIGGGGLVAGSILAAASAQGWNVVGVESAQSRAVSTSADLGEVVQVEIGATIADGLAGNIEPGTVSPDVIRAAGVPVLGVDDAHIRRAVALLAMRAGLVVEPAGASGVATMLSGQLEAAGPVVFVLTGRNISTALLRELLEIYDA
ncbi:MAG TPA: pyridoxal-phosphate dependent enzyme [Actinomycetota bacterium]|nr:pyridoxal-phosphate dependent enzyme [Actinomycetota bacterium]